MTFDRRLKVIARRLPPTKPPPPRIDFDRLEVSELEQLEALLVQAGYASNGRLEFRNLSDEEVDRIAELTAKAQVSGRA